MPPAKKAAHAAKKAAAPAKAAPQTTVTKHLAAALAEDHNLSKKQTEVMLGDLVSLTTGHIKKGDKIRLNGIGILQVRIPTMPSGHTELEASTCSDLMPSTVLR